MSRTPDEVFLLVFGGIAVILVTARLLGRLFVRIGQPAVVGEVVGGLVLGPSLLGLLPGDPSQLLFPADIQPFLRIIAQFGLIVYMFIVGLELDTRALSGSGRVAATISLSSIAFPLVLGGVAGALLHPWHDHATRLVGTTLERTEVDLVPFALFCGLTISGSAFAILARILDERGLFRTPLGMVLMGCAVVDDLAVWVVAAVVLAVAASSSLLDLPLTLGGLAAFVAFLFLVVRPALARTVTPRYQRSGLLSPDLFAVVLVGLLLSALATTWLGISPILGSFLFGASFPRSGTGGLVSDINTKLESVSVLVLLPVFFVVTGLGVDLSQLGWSGLATLVLFVAVATGGKLLGATVGAAARGIRGRRGMAIGVLMNTRGLTELALLSLGRDLGVLDTTMFTALVCTAIVTTLLSGPLLGLVYPASLIRQDIADAERARLAATDSYRVLLVVHDPEGAAASVDLATALARSEPDAEVVLSRIAPSRPRTELGSGLFRDLGQMATSLEELRVLAGRVTAHGVRVVPQSQFSDDPAGELVHQVLRLRPNIVLLTAEHPEADVLAARLVDEARIDVAVVRPELGTTIPPAIRVGSGADRHVSLAAEVAVRLAIVWGVPVVLGAGRRLRSLAPVLSATGAPVVSDDVPGALLVATELLHVDATVGVRAADVATARSFERVRGGAGGGDGATP